MRKRAHFQENEALLENFIRSLRINKVKKLIPPKSKILDIGCGYQGYFLNKIKNHISLGVGLDVDVKGNFEKDKKINLKRVKLLKNIPEKVSSFDVVTALAIIEHLDFPQDILSEIHRVLKPGGICILTTPNKIYKPLLEFLAFTGLLSKSEIQDHKQYFNKKTLAKILLDAGFDKKSIRVSSFMFGLGMNLLAVAKKN